MHKKTALESFVEKNVLSISILSRLARMQFYPLYQAGQHSVDEDLCFNSITTTIAYCGVLTTSMQVDDEDKLIGIVKDFLESEIGKLKLKTDKKIFKKCIAKHLIGFKYDLSSYFYFFSESAYLKLHNAVEKVMLSMRED